MNEQQLLELKNRIDRSKTKAAELRGSQQQLMKQLNDDWKCTTVETAEKRMQEMEAEIKTLNQKIEKGIKELEEKYNI